MTPTRPGELRLLVFIFIVSFLLHALFISRFSTPVFDEMHFATYAAQYARHEAHFDIHPPLGKLLYAAVLSLYPSSTYNEATYIKIDTQDSRGHSGGELHYFGIARPFASFPYVALRLLASFFGALLPVLGYILLKHLTSNPFAPFFAAFLLLFENALLMETRLILLNGMMLSFGILALIFFWGKKQNIILAGLCLGLALGVKLSASVFVVPIFLGFVFNLPRKTFREHEWDLGTMGGIALLVLALVSASHFLVIQPAEQIAVLRDFGSQLTPGLPFSDAAANGWLGKTALFFKAFLDQFDAMVGGYLSGTSSHISMSQWFTWPFMQGGFSYSSVAGVSTILLLPIRALFEFHGKQMGLLGNIAVWLLGTIAVLWTGWFVIRKKFRTGENKLFFVLFVGWLSALLPFVSVVKRTSFLYHYFPALFFGTLLAAYWIGVALEKTPRRHRWKIIAPLAVVVLGGFLLAAPYTYGL